MLSPVRGVAEIPWQGGLAHFIPEGLDDVPGQKTIKGLQHQAFDIPTIHSSSQSAHPIPLSSPLSYFHCDSQHGDQGVPKQFPSGGQPGRGR